MSIQQDASHQMVTTANYVESYSDPPRITICKLDPGWSPSLLVGSGDLTN